MTDYYVAARPDGSDPSFPDINYVDLLRSGSDAKSGDMGFSIATVPSDCRRLHYPGRIFKVEPLTKAFANTPASAPNERKCYALRVTRELPIYAAFGPTGLFTIDLLKEIETLDAASIIKLGTMHGDNSTMLRRIESRNEAQKVANASGYGAAMMALARTVGEDLMETYWERVDDLFDAMDRVDQALHPENARKLENESYYANVKDVAVNAATAAARNALRGLLMRNVLHPDHYDVLTEAWRTCVGSIHPFDLKLKK